MVERPRPRLTVNPDPVFVRRRRVAGVLVVALLVGLIASLRLAWGVLGPDDGNDGPTVAGSPAATPPASAPATPSATPTPTPTPTPEKQRSSVTLSFAGDAHFETQLRALLKAPGANQDQLAAALGAADFTMLNLETAITERGTPIPGKTYTFRTPAKALDYLQGLGVDAVTVANNHAADFGAVGLQDTLAAKAAAPIPVIGVGKDITEAFAPLSIELGGNRIAIVTSSQLTEETSTLYGATASRPGIATNNVSNDALVAAVKAARTGHDVVIAFMHWGTETQTCPDDRQRRTLDALVAAGADVVVGGHAHRVQGSGWKGTTFVDYGLGNFLWYNNRGASGDTGMLTITVDGDKVTRRAKGESVGSVVTEQKWTSMTIGGNGIPVVATGNTQARLATAKSAADQCSGLSATAP